MFERVNKGKNGKRVIEASLEIQSATGYGTKELSKSTSIYVCVCVGGGGGN